MKYDCRVAIDLDDDPYTYQIQVFKEGRSIIAADFEIPPMSKLLSLANGSEPFFMNIENKTYVLSEQLFQCVLNEVKKNGILERFVH